MLYLTHVQRNDKLGTTDACSDYFHKAQITAIWNIYGKHYVFLSFTVSGVIVMFLGQTGRTNSNFYMLFGFLEV